jgi:hypothetical protein
MVKVQVSLLRAMQAPILDPGTRMGWVFRAMPHLLYFQERDPVPIVEEAGWVQKVLPTPCFKLRTIYLLNSNCYFEYLHNV